MRLRIAAKFEIMQCNDCRNNCCQLISHDFPAAIASMNVKLDAAEKVVEAARKVGMNWKMGAPYGLDALDDALAQWLEVK